MLGYFILRFCVLYLVCDFGLWGISALFIEVVSFWHIQVGIQNFPDLCHHLYSGCDSAKHCWMVGLPCLVSLCAKLHVAGWT